MTYFFILDEVWKVLLQVKTFSFLVCWKKFWIFADTVEKNLTFDLAFSTEFHIVSDFFFDFQPTVADSFDF